MSIESLCLLAGLGMSLQAQDAPAAPRQKTFTLESYTESAPGHLLSGLHYSSASLKAGAGHRDEDDATYTTFVSHQQIRGGSFLDMHLNYVHSENQRGEGKAQLANEKGTLAFGVLDSVAHDIYGRASFKGNLSDFHFEVGAQAASESNGIFGYLHDSNIKIGGRIQGDEASAVLGFVFDAFNLHPGVDLWYTAGAQASQRIMATMSLSPGPYFRDNKSIARAYGGHGVIFDNPLFLTSPHMNRIPNIQDMGGIFNLRFTYAETLANESFRVEAVGFPFREMPLQGIFLGGFYDLKAQKENSGAIIGYKKWIGDFGISAAAAILSGEQRIDASLMYRF